MNRKEKIVVPWDFSDHAKAALRFARGRFLEESIVVVSVLERPNPYSAGVSFGPEAEARAADQCRQQFLKEAGLPDESMVTFDVLFGEPADQICRYSEQVRPDYLVMATHGRTGINKMILGSVAQSIVSNTSSPVILLPSKWFERQKHPDHLVR